MTDLSPTDHELWKLIRARVAAGYPMTGIAAEIGIDVDDLCAWIMAYREPRRDKAYLRRDGPPLAANDKMVRTHWSQSQQAQRFANWRKSTAAAVKARAGA